MHVKSGDFGSGALKLAGHISAYFLLLFPFDSHYVDSGDAGNLLDLVNLFDADFDTFLGLLLFRQSPLGYITYALVILSFVVIYRTSWGLSIIATGENPEAAETLGVSVTRTRYMSLMASGGLCALGGVFLSVDSTGLFLDNMTAGRGYIALALLILGRRHPFGLLAANLLYSVGRAIAWCRERVSDKEWHAVDRELLDVWRG